jgi:hypothetical protein
MAQTETAYVDDVNTHHNSKPNESIDMITAMTRDYKDGRIFWKLAEERLLQKNARIMQWIGNSLEGESLR